MVGPSLDTTKLHLKAPSSATATIKFLCSYGGKIIPRFPDGKLRYQGGETRVIGVDRSISFAGQCFLYEFPPSPLSFTFGNSFFSFTCIKCYAFVMYVCGYMMME
jgi:hypothetical protein